MDHSSHDRNRPEAKRFGVKLTNLSIPKMNLVDIVIDLLEAENLKSKNLTDEYATLCQLTSPLLFTLNDQDEVALERHDCDKDIFELLDEFASVREASVRFIEQLSASDLERTGAHPKIGLIRVRELLHERLYHDLNHARQVGLNAQQLMWHQLGNMQGFYAV